MRKSAKITIVAASALAMAAVGTLAWSGSSEADTSSWHRGGEAHGKMHRAGHRMMRGGMHMHMGRAMMIDHLFDMADLDDDGTITREELEEAIASRIEAHDADGDGTLDLEEYEGLFLELVRPMMVRSFQFLDRDGSGTIAAEDIERPIGRMFDRLDRDDSGTIARDDLRRGRGWHRHRHRGDWGQSRRDRREMHRQMREERRQERRERRRGDADTE